MSTEFYIGGRRWTAVEMYAVALTAVGAWHIWDMNRERANKCGCHGAGMSAVEKDTGGGLLPIMDPLFNVREICKQLVLLEDHLTQRRKRCLDCIRKHFLTLEALAEEALTLDKKHAHSDLLEDLPEIFRRLQADLRVDQTQAGRGNEHEVAQKLRELRKKLMPACCHKF
jgi:hypothetical protein